MNNKKIFSFTILIILIFSVTTSISGTTNLSSEIVLIPLDSRPCNIDYPIYAAKAINKNINFPKESLDNYYKPSESENLYKYLYDSLGFADTYIIYTNQILNGGLIASRDPKSYIDLEDKLKDFENFLKVAKDQEKSVTVISVLPRVIPSQFTDLWNFKEELISFSSVYGKYQINLSDTQPTLPPKEVLSRYLSIYSGSDTIISNMKANVEKGLIDLLVIGQDDTYKDSITNQQINNYLNYNNHKIIVQPGADELTNLVLARMVREESNKSPLDLNVIFTDNLAAKDIKLFESFSTEKRSQQILDFLSIGFNKNSENLAIIHNNPSSTQKTIETIYNNVNKNYLGLVDVAYINRGDKKLFENPNFIKNLKGYSGWNTVGNSLGSEYANFVFYDYIEKNLSSFNDKEQEKMLENYYNLLYLHFADDYLYQALLRDQLNSFLLSNKDDFSFILDKKSADDFLQEIYQIEASKLIEPLRGSYNHFNTTFKVENKSTHISLPWKRTFEAKIRPNIKIIKDR